MVGRPPTTKRRVSLERRSLRALIFFTVGEWAYDRKNASTLALYTLLDAPSEHEVEVLPGEL